MRLLLALAVLFAVACNPASQTADTGPTLAPLAPVSAGACPAITAPGPVNFTVNGVSRVAYIYFPESKPAHLPVVFFWHPLGATAIQMARLIHAQTLADSEGLILVMPQSQPNEPYEWQFYMDDGGNDAIFYDDLRTCVVQELQGDKMRLSSAGFSAGGLWNSWMTVHRSDTLSTSLVMSGGTGEVVYYESPDTNIPVLVMWGGTADHFTLGTHTVDFNYQSEQFIDDLVQDGHFVVGCNHGQGHTIPIDGIGVIPGWLLPHVFGQPSPFENGDLSKLPRYCQIYTQADLPVGGSSDSGN